MSEQKLFQSCEGKSIILNRSGELVLIYVYSTHTFMNLYNLVPRTLVFAHNKLNFKNSLSVGTFFSKLEGKYLNIRMKGSCNRE